MFMTQVYMGHSIIQWKIHDVLQSNLWLLDSFFITYLPPCLYTIYILLQIIPNSHAIIFKRCIFSQTLPPFGLLICIFFVHLCFNMMGIFRYLGWMKVEKFLTSEIVLIISVAFVNRLFSKLAMNREWILP